MSHISNFFTIKEPFYEGLRKMSVSEKGKFCSSCKKIRENNKKEKKNI